MDIREFLTLSVKSAMAAGLTSAIPASLLYPYNTRAATLAAGLSDPAMQLLFVHHTPNALADSFKYVPRRDRLKIIAAQIRQFTGLVGGDGVTPVATTVWGYGPKDARVSWPGMTIERHVADAPLKVVWKNHLYGPVHEAPLPHLLPVEASLHRTYSLPGYEQYSMEIDGVPLVPHVHGGRNDWSSDGNPGFFFSPSNEIKGPRWATKSYTYGGADWNDKAGMMWYHDHAPGITRLNVYAGLAGLFVLRDDLDTGRPDNPLGLPGGPYELGFAIQDRMFRHNGELFFPTYPGDPLHADFIDGEGAALPPDVLPAGGPSALAAFFGDHMVVNGVIWPKYSVECRQYRVRLLNGSDSRFMRLRLKMVPAGETDPAVGAILPFYVIGSDQSLNARAALVEEADFLPGERLDLVIDFKMVPVGYRVIVENLFGDAPYRGGLPAVDDLFPNRRTDRIMAFDTELPFDTTITDAVVMEGYELGGGPNVTAAPPVRIRRLALFKGVDEKGRPRPLLGTAEPVTDVAGNVVNGALPWHAPITENPCVGDTEVWEIYNTTGEAHPVHVHLVHFEVLDREGFSADAFPQPVLQHNGSQGLGFRLENIVTDGVVSGPGVTEQSRRDMVMSLPGQVTRIKMTFGKPGRYVWHCYIRSHEDSEMMRPFHVGPVSSSGWRR